MKRSVKTVDEDPHPEDSVNFFIHENSMNLTTAAGRTI